MKFTKMQGAGNDYIYINCFEEAPPQNPSELSKKLSDRHFGIGSDGIILILPSEVANLRMKIYNADGTEAQVCGNGLRCAGKFAYEHGICRENELLVETLAGVKKLRLNIEDGAVKSVRVNMGAPSFKPASLPMNVPDEDFINKPIAAAGRIFSITALSMGNPHCVIFAEALDRLDLELYGPAIENHSLFPERVNVEFAEAVAEGVFKVRVWERGSGETLACGSGASAVLAAAYVNGKCGGSAKIILSGGELFVERDEYSGEIYMTGGAEIVFNGVI